MLTLSTQQQNRSFHVVERMGPIAKYTKLKKRTWKTYQTFKKMEISDSLSLSLLKLWETFLIDDIILAFIAQDGAEPSANSSSVGNLIRLHSFTGDKKYVERAEQIIKASVTLLSKLPLALPELVSNYMLYLQPKRQVHLPSYALSKLRHSLCQSDRDISSQ